MSTQRLKILVPFLLLAYHSAFSQRQKVETFYDIKRLILKESYYVLKKSPNTLDSTYTSYFQNSKVKSTGIFKNNKANGEWKYYYENGNLKMEGPFKDNDHNGYWKYYYEDGTTNMEGQIYKEIKEGEWKYYYENGNVKNSGAYKKNRKIGMWKYFHEEGTLKAQATFENDKGHYIEIYENGNPKSEGDIVDGKSNGLWKYFYEDGKVKAEGNEKDGQKEGIWKYYHPNGMPASEGSFIKGKPNGKWKYYHDNGNLSSEGDQQEGQKDGYWKVYYRNGNFKGEGNFEKGEGPYKEYYESGKIKTEGYVKNDKNDGQWKYYYESGALEGTCFYNNGSGKYTGYYQDGSLKMEGLLNNGNKEGIWKLYKDNGQIAGYYKTYYENDAPIMRLIDSSSVEEKRDSLGPSTKPNLKLRKKKSRYFTPKLKEFQGYILSMGPLGLLAGTVPLNLEYYFQERLGYEINFTLHRSPFFGSEINLDNYEIALRGFSAHIRQKFYQRDNDVGMFYFAHEIRYTRNNYDTKIIDSTMSINSFPISKVENTVEYSVLVGSRFLKDSKSEGFTLDIFIGLGIGYRNLSSTWDGHGEYNQYFNSVSQTGVTVPFRFGMNVGYIFKNKGR